MRSQADIRTARRARQLAEERGLPPILRVGKRESEEAFLRYVNDTVERFQAAIEGLSLDGTMHKIDEVALLAPQGTEGDDWFTSMLWRVGKRGITYFNQTDDKVQAIPLPSQYDVRYDFFTTELGVRLELLRLRGGISPLHELYLNHPAAQGSAGYAPIVHASWKVDDEDTYTGVTRLLFEAGWVMGQGCTSAYGKFSYWRNPLDDGPMVWLKPRVNLRDSQPQLDDLDELDGGEDEEEDEDADY